MNRLFKSSTKMLLLLLLCVFFAVLISTPKIYEKASVGSDVGTRISVASGYRSIECKDGKGRCSYVDPSLPYVTLELPPGAVITGKKEGLTGNLYLELEYVDKKIQIKDRALEPSLLEPGKYINGAVNTVLVRGRQEHEKFEDFVRSKVELLQGVSGVGLYNEDSSVVEGYSVYDSEICRAASAEDIYLQKKDVSRCSVAKLVYFSRQYRDAIAICDRAIFSSGKKLKRPICTIYSAGTPGLLLSYMNIGPIEKDLDWIEVDKILNKFIQQYIR